MAGDIRIWRIRTAMALNAAALPLVCLSGSPANAQSVMRTPSLRVGLRAPSINSNITPRVNSNIGATADPVAPRQRHADDACGASHRRTIDAAQCALFAKPVSGLRIRLSRQRRRMPRPSRRLRRWRRRQERRFGKKRRAMAARATTRSADRRQPAGCPQRARGRDRRRADQQAGRGTGAASWPDPSGGTEFSAARCDHRSVPHHGPAAGRCGAP